MTFIVGDFVYVYMYIVQGITHDLGMIYMVIIYDLGRCNIVIGIMYLMVDIASCRFIIIG